MNGSVSPDALHVQSLFLLVIVGIFFFDLFCANTCIESFVRKMLFWALESMLSSYNVYVYVR